MNLATSVEYSVLIWCMILPIMHDGEPYLNCSFGITMYIAKQILVLFVYKNLNTQSIHDGLSGYPMIRSSGEIVALTS